MNSIIVYKSQEEFIRAVTEYFANKNYIVWYDETTNDGSDEMQEFYEKHYICPGYYDGCRYLGNPYINNVIEHDGMCFKY